MAGVRMRATSAAPGRPSATTVVMFEYAGAGEASIRGPATGTIYHFTRPGDRVRVDPRDRPGLAELRTLRWVR
jgi:hypothetical protein